MYFVSQGLASHVAGSKTPVERQLTLPLPESAYPCRHVYGHEIPVEPLHVVLPPLSVVCKMGQSLQSLAVQSPP